MKLTNACTYDNIQIFQMSLVYDADMQGILNIPAQWIGVAIAMGNDATPPPSSVSNAQKQFKGQQC